MDAKINEIKIKNFMSLKDISINTKKMNIFIGENNAGKSAILKCVALFGQSIDKWDFSGELVDFGVPQNIVTKGENRLDIDFKFNFEQQKNDDIVQINDLKSKHLTFGLNINLYSNREFWTQFNILETRVSYIDDKSLYVQYAPPIFSTIVGEVLYNNQDDILAENIDLGPFGQYYVDKIKKLKGELTLFDNQFLTGDSPIDTVKIWTKSGQDTIKINNNEIKINNIESEPKFKDLINDVRTRLENTTFFKVPRPKILRNYALDPEIPKSIDADLNKLPEIIANYLYYKDYGLPLTIDKIMEKGEDFKLPNITVSPHPNNKLSLDLKVENEKIPLSDSGFGLNQVFLLLSGLLSTKSGSITLIEEPETSLHPKNQAKMLDFIYQMTKEKNLQSFITTHSSHFLTRLQRRVAEGKIDVSDIAVYWCELDDNLHTKISKVKIDDDGAFPDGLTTYLDFILEEQNAIANARKNKSNSTSGE